MVEAVLIWIAVHYPYFALAMAITLMVVWTRVHTPTGYSREAGTHLWTDGERLWFALGQGALWPVFLFAYILWGVVLGMDVGGKSLIRLLEKKPPKTIDVKEDNALTEAAAEVERMLDPTAPYEELKSI